MEETKKYIYIVDEFGFKSNSPNAKHVADLVSALSEENNCIVKYIYFSKKYKPGAFKLKRIFNLFYAFFYMTFFIINLSFKKSQKKCILTLTSPPTIHLYICFLSKIFSIPCHIWLMDAHPEIEAQILDKLNLKLFSNFLRAVEKLILNCATSIVCLDESMKNRLLNAKIDNPNISLSSPWATYIFPAKSIIGKEIVDKISFIYAGNYGIAHDLSMFADFIYSFSSLEQRKIHFTFVGLSENAEEKIRTLFLPLFCHLNFIPRKDKIEDVISLFSQFHFGIVSMSNSQAGLVCPSKAYTYISQGLPIYYLGPRFTLSDSLCQEGFGLNHDYLKIEEGFEEWIELCQSYLNKKKNLVLDEPNIKAIENLKSVLLNEPHVILKWRPFHPMLKTLGKSIDFFLYPFSFMMNKKSDINNPKKILIIEFFLIGDNIITTALINSLKQNFNNAEIHVFGNSWAKEIFSPQYVSCIYTAKVPWISFDYSIKNIIKFFKIILTLRKEKYDIIIETKGDWRNCFIAWLIGAKTRVSTLFTGGKSFINLPTNTIDAFSNINMVRYELAKSLINEPKNFKLTLEIKKESSEFIENFLEKSGIKKKEFYVFHPGASNKNRMLSKKVQIEVISILTEKYDCVVCLGPNDIYSVNENDLINLKFHNKVVFFQENLNKLMELLKQSSCNIVMDSAAAHISAAVDNFAIVFVFHKNAWNYVKPLSDKNYCIEYNDSSWKNNELKMEFKEILFSSSTSH